MAISGANNDGIMSSRYDKIAELRTNWKEDSKFWNSIMADGVIDEYEARELGLEGCDLKKATEMVKEWLHKRIQAALIINGGDCEPQHGLSNDDGV